MQTGPGVSGGYDIALTEVLNESAPYYLAQSGTARGARILTALPGREAHEAELQAGAAVVAQTARKMGRTLDTAELPALLRRNLEHPRWNAVAERCLSCANCTLVCPTCFCSTVEDITDLTGGHAERWRKWDSCFTLDFSHVHGGSVRASCRSRYRQWLTHKLGTWHAQFGVSGCVGCGRCITWCPVGIDLTEEAAAIRATDGAAPAPVLPGAPTNHD
jgi:ferredoxin